MRSPLALLRARSTPQLAGASVALSLGWFVWPVVVDDAPTAVSSVLVALSAVVAPVLAVVVGVRLVAAPLGLSHRFRRALQATSATAVVALALTSNSFFVGFNEADAGRPNGLYASLTTTLALVSVTAFAAVIAIVLFAVVRRRLVPRASFAIAIALGVIAAPLVALTLLVPGAVVAFSLVVFVYAVLPVLSRTIKLPRIERPSVPVEGVRARVIHLAGASLAVSLAVWVGGITVSIANTGTDIATVGLGLASAAGQLAVIPLLWAATVVLEVWLPNTAATTRIGFAVASAVVTGTTIAMIIGYSSDGNRFMLLVAVLSLGIGFWAASVVWAVGATYSTVVRAVASLIVLVAATAVYAFSAALSGGIALALLSGFLAFGGARLVLRQQSPA